MAAKASFERRPTHKRFHYQRVDGSFITRAFLKLATTDKQGKERLVRIAVLAERRVLIADTLERVAATDNAWIQEYFHGPRGRAAAAAVHSYNQPEQC